MKRLLFRFEMCWLCLTSRRAMLYCPRRPTPLFCEARKFGGGRFSSGDWSAIVQHAAEQLRVATAAAEARLLADIRAAEDEYQQDVLLEQARALASPVPGRR